MHLLGTSGTVTTIAGVHLGLPRYDRRRVDGCWMSDDEVTGVVERLLAMTYDERVANPCIGAERADLVLAGCAILEAIRRAFPCARLRVADRGLREGMLVQMMRADGVWGARRRASRDRVTREQRPSGGERDLQVRVKTGKSRTLSSKLWLERQLNDPYVARAKREGYRSRAAYKLIEIDDKFAFSKPGARVVDLGAAPGGWSQIAAKRVGARRTARAAWSPSTFSTWTRSPASISCSSISSIRRARHAESRCSAARPMSCCPTWRRTPPAIARPIISRSWRWSRRRRNSPREVLAPGGAFLAKVLQGGTESELLAVLKRDFATVQARQAGGEPREFGRTLRARDRVSAESLIPKMAPRSRPAQRE